MRNEGKEIPWELTINTGDNNSGSTLFRQPSGEEEGVAGANRIEAAAARFDPGSAAGVELETLT